MSCGKTVHLPIIENYSLFEKDYTQIKQNKTFSSGLRKNYERVAHSKAEIDDKISLLLRRWKEGKQSTSASPLSKIKIDPLTAQKAYKIRLAMKVAGLGVALLGGAALTALPMAAGIYVGAHFPYALSALVHVLVPFGGTLPAFVVPSAVPMLGIMSGACAGGGFLSYLAYSSLDNCKTIREERVQKDKNFQEFVANYLEKNLSFIPRYEDLTDQELHSIYFQWKNRMQNLPTIYLSYKGDGYLKRTSERA